MQDPVADDRVSVDVNAVATSINHGDGNQTHRGGGNGSAAQTASAGFYNRDGIPHPVAARRSIVVSEAVNVEAALADLGVDYADLLLDPTAARRMMTSEEAGPRPRLMTAREAGTDRVPPSDEELRAEIHAGTFISRPAVAVADQARWLESALLREAEPAMGGGRGKGVDEAALRRMSGVRRDACVPLQLFDDESQEHRTPHEWMALATPQPSEVEWLGKRVPTDPRVLATRRREERAEAAKRVQAAQRGARARREHQRRVQLARQQAAEKRAMDGAILLRAQARQRSKRRLAMRRGAEEERPTPAEPPPAVADRPAGMVIASVVYADCSAKGGDGGSDDGGMWRVQLRPYVSDATSAASSPIRAPTEEEGGAEPPAPAIANDAVVSAPEAAGPAAASQRLPNAHSNAALAALAAAGAATCGAKAASHAATNTHDVYADMVLSDAAGILRPLGGGQLQGKALLW